MSKTTSPCFRHLPITKRLNTYTITKNNSDVGVPTTKEKVIFLKKVLDFGVCFCYKASVLRIEVILRDFFNGLGGVSFNTGVTQTEIRGAVAAGLGGVSFNTGVTRIE